MTRRRILHCIPGMGGGGAERQLAYLSGGLVRLGWDVHVALVSGGPNLERLERSGAVIHRIAARSNHDPAILWRLTRTIERLQPHVVQVWLLQMDILGGIAARLRGVPWILSERCSERAYPGTLKYRARQWVAHAASAVVSNSEGGREYWHARLGARTRGYVIPNALPLDEIDAEAPADASRTHVPGSDALVVFAGRLTEQKNPETTIAALARVLGRPHTAAAIVGEGPMRRSLDGLVRQHGLDGRVVFPGYVEHLWAWLKRASVFVSPSRFEGHPNTVLEAAACGCPLVVSDIPAHREFLDASSALFVDPDDAEALAAAIADVLDHPAAARSRAETARGTVARWSVDRVAAQYERVYLDVLERTA